MKYPTTEGQTYAIVGTADGTITSATGVVIASFTANKQAYFTAPVGGYVTISDENAIVTAVFKLAPGALAGTSDGGDTPGGGGDYGDYIGYIEYDDATGAIFDLSVPKYTLGNLTFKNEVFSDELSVQKIDIPYLTDGTSMFERCTNLTSFSGDLSNLTEGNRMFYNCTSLTSFSADLPALADGRYMFNGCTNLTSWNIPLPKMTIGYYMFNGCTNLTSFSVDLSALTSGDNMFYNCKLDAASVERILTTIQPNTNPEANFNLTLHFSSEAASKFEEITGVTPTTTEQWVSYKGWTIKAMIYNG